MSARTAPASGLAPHVERESRRRRAGAWGVIGAALVVAGIGVAALTSLGQWTQRDALDAESAGPMGTRALAHILDDHGVRVEIPSGREAAERALAEAGGDATLVLGDTAPLSDDALTALVDAAGSVVLIDPRSRDLRILLDSEPAGVADDARALPSCQIDAAQRAGAITPGAVYLVSDGTGSATQTCYPSGDGAALLLSGDDARIAAIDGGAVLTNEHLADEGNASLAIALTGRHPRVVWYLPTIADSDLAGDEPTLGELTPDWVTPAIVLLVCAALAAAVWRGRRFGPLVAEKLPVTVRTAETTEGRAHLYARSADRLHALDQLRIGTLGRISLALGLGAAASADDIADAAAARTGADRARVRAALLTSVPRTDGDLVALAHTLRELEAAVERAVRPERNPS